MPDYTVTYTGTERYPLDATDRPAADRVSADSPGHAIIAWNDLHLRAPGDGVTDPDDHEVYDVVVLGGVGETRTYVVHEGVHGQVVIRERA